MHVRTPDFQLDEGPLLWARTPEFSMTYNAYGVVIPYVEYYLNAVMNRLRTEACADKPELKETVATFVRQETVHARYHNRFNERMFAENITGLRELVDQMVAELKEQRETRSLAFNVAYCAGFECIATFAAKYLHTQCDAYFDGADARGANLLLWHVAEEFEHREVCHQAFAAVSGNYFIRLAGLIHAFRHVGGAFVRAENLVVAHYAGKLPEHERRATLKRSRRLFWRQLAYVAPRMLQIFLPFYDPARLKVPPQVASALDFYRGSGPIVTHARAVAT